MGRIGTTIQLRPALRQGLNPVRGALEKRLPIAAAFGEGTQLTRKRSVKNPGTTLPYVPAGVLAFVPLPLLPAV